MPIFNKIIYYLIVVLLTSAFEFIKNLFLDYLDLGIQYIKVIKIKSFDSFINLFPSGLSQAPKLLCLKYRIHSDIN